MVDCYTGNGFWLRRLNFLNYYYNFLGLARYEIQQNDPNAVKTVEFNYCNLNYIVLSKIFF